MPWPPLLAPSFAASRRAVLLADEVLFADRGSEPMSVPNVFEPARVSAFRYVSAFWDEAESTARFTYALDDLVLCETFAFPAPSGDLERGNSARRRALDRILGHLFLAAGISYYKCAAPARVVIEDGSFSAEDIAYHRLLLAKGLGEFCWANGLDPDLSPTYEVLASRPVGDPIMGLALDRGPLVPVGGGKDSCVTMEALRPLQPTLITVNRYPVIHDVIHAAGLPDLLVRRTLDPQLHELNRRGARNGHVPVTAIVSWACLAAAVLHGHDAVVMSNERSASEGNVVYRGVEINHQWSKSEEAEAGLTAALARITGELRWFSLLRHLSEVSIVREFATTGERYRKTFSSCNAAFRMDASRRVTRWCGTCPKCQFVYLALATSMAPGEMDAIFGNDLFRSSPIEGFAALLGLAEWKPFECVGESGECRAALRMLTESESWRQHDIVAELAARVRAAGMWPSDDDVKSVLSPSELGPSVPKPYRERCP